MDRNTVIGFVLIALLIIAYTYFNLPSATEQARIQKQNDSVAVVYKQKQIADSIQAITPLATTVENKTDSVIATATGIFNNAVSGEKKNYVIENELLKITLSNEGAKVASVQLKKYKTYSGDPLVLFNEENTKFNYVFFSGNTQVETNNLIFATDGNSFSVSGTDSNSITFRAYATSTRYIEQKFTLTGNSYKLGYTMSMVGMDSIIRNANTYINLIWDTKFNHTEHDLESERKFASVYLRNWDDDVEGISEASTDSIRAPGNLQWVSCKTHFFNASLISTKPFDQGNITSSFQPNAPYVKELKAELILPFDSKSKIATYPMHFYFGPNNYQELKKLDICLEEVIPLKAGLFGIISSPLNKYFFIPLFNWLDNYIVSYGLIILVMTILLRIVLYPFTYKSFISAAKMRILKPEIDELKEKYKDDQTKFGAEQMALFRKAGVNPLGGCIPLLFQLPILAAMYTFFPQSIELRQQSLWWVKDLSTYDSIYNFSTTIPFYGNHVSLWTLIMTATSILFAVYNNQLSGVQGQMKWMAYIFPLMLLGVFNTLPAALTYYYSLSNVVSFGQQFIVKNFVIDEAAIHRQIQENKKKTPKKSSWQKKLEDMQRSQQAKGKKK